jgi:fructokinase
VTYGAIEAGGTKWVCAIGTSPEDVHETAVFPTTTPDETIARAIAFFRAADGEPLEAIGIGSFGPVDLHPDSPTWGSITSTPKAGWQNTDLAGALGDALHTRIAFDTDVNAAALGEHRWGAARGLETFCYITVGTGIGAGGIINDRPMHGLAHPEFGHMLIPHDRERDPFPGVCPYHADCLEGLASGEALVARWGVRGEQITDVAAWALEADYLALGIVNATFMFSPQRVVIGGGVMKQASLLPMIRERVLELVDGYVQIETLAGGIDTYIVPPALGDRAGVLGAMELARLATGSATAVARSIELPAPASYDSPQ